MKPLIRFAEIGQKNTASNPQALLRFVHPDRILNTGVPSKAKKERKKEQKSQLLFVFTQNILNTVLFWAAVNCPYMENSIWQLVPWLLLRPCECCYESNVFNTNRHLKSEQRCPLLHKKKKVWDKYQQLDGRKSISLSCSNIRGRESI